MEPLPKQPGKRAWKPLIGPMLYFPRCGFGWLGGLAGGQWPPHGCAGFGCHGAAPTAAGWIPGEKQVRYPPLMTPNVAFRNGGDLNFTSGGSRF